MRTGAASSASSRPSCPRPSTQFHGSRVPCRPPPRRSECWGRDAASRGDRPPSVRPCGWRELVRERRQRHQRKAAEAERPGLAVDDEPLYPVAGSGRFDVQVQSVAVAVPARPGDRAAEGCRQSLDGMGTPGLVLSRSAGSRGCMIFHVQFWHRLEQSPSVPYRSFTRAASPSTTPFYRGILAWSQLGNTRTEQEAR